MPGEQIETISILHNAEEIPYEIDVTLIVPLAAGDGVLPTRTELLAAFPNPFNPTTTLNFSLSSAQKVSLKLYSIQGREVAQLVNEQLPAGVHTRSFDGSSLSAGVYFAEFQTDNIRQTQKILLIK